MRMDGRNLQPDATIALEAPELTLDMENALEDALLRLATYRAGWDAADVIDYQSGLSVADLDVIISLAPALRLNVKGDILNDN